MKSIRTIRSLWRVYRHRKAGHVLIVDPGAVTCQTCAKGRERCAGCTWHDCPPCVRAVYRPQGFVDGTYDNATRPCRCGHQVGDHGETKGCRICDCPRCWWSVEMTTPPVGEVGA